MQLGQYCASSHRTMRVLPPEIVAGFEDFRIIFGSDADALSFQSAEVQITAQRTWLRLVGQRHELQRWAPDTRLPPLDFKAPHALILEALPWVRNHICHHICRHICRHICNDLPNMAGPPDP